MRTSISAFLLLIATCALCAAQSASSPRLTTIAHDENPTAIIHTTACCFRELLPKVAPIGVDNFIGLATGTKDWTSPVTHEKKHGEPLYDGTIFHRVIPNFMIQGGDAAGNGMGDPGYKFKNEVSDSSWL